MRPTNPPSIRLTSDERGASRGKSAPLAAPSMFHKVGCPPTTAAHSSLHRVGYRASPGSLLATDIPFGPLPATAQGLTDSMELSRNSWSAPALSFHFVCRLRVELARSV